MRSLKAFLHCKKRKSNRLEEKEKEEKKTHTIKYGPLGYFDILPMELKFNIMEHLSLVDLSLLTITSKSMRNLIEGFRVTRPIGKYLLPKPPHTGVSVDKQQLFLLRFNKLGLLMKRSTCLYSTKDRLKIMNDFLTRLMCANTESCQDPIRCIALSCFGKFFYTVVAGWDDSELQKAFDAICVHTNITKTLSIAVNSKPGVHNKIEFGVRLFYRRVFLDQCQTLQERAFWLTRILKPSPIVHQARLLFILYGPYCDEDLLWYEMCESTPSCQVQSRQHFGELANAMQILHYCQLDWSEDDIVSILDELTGAPEEWLSENVAHLLLLCGDVITSKMMISKAINGRITELSSVTTSLCLVSVKCSYSMSYVASLIMKIADVLESSKERMNFFNRLIDMFKDLIMDIHEFSDPEDDERESDMLYMVTALSEFTKKIMQIAFKSILS